MDEIDSYSSAFLVASYLTDPVCKAHENFRRLHVVDALNPTASKVTNLVRKIFLWMAVIGYATVALFTTLPGIALRGLAAHWQKVPYLSVKGEGSKKLSEDRTFSLLSWNICCVGAGYAITDGGVVPWRDRIDAVADQMIEKNADVNCLYETFDTQSAFILTEKLKENGYSHFYYDIGPKAMGVSSGIMIASKYEIKDPEFTLFPQDTLVGRTKHAAKGVFGFDLVSEGASFARVFSTHLQHSEEPAFPTVEEGEGRRKQMEIILSKVDQVRDRCLVVTGDLNLDDDEYAASAWQGRFDRGAPFEGKTWGGDQFCVGLVGKRISRALNLDHTMILRGTARAIATDLVKTGYDPTQFKRGALSDHEGLYSRIQL
jgi:endonuclease/exonuclease/phosphatase family metal-dependent hydrolase